MEKLIVFTSLSNYLAQCVAASRSDKYLTEILAAYKAYDT